MTKAEMDALYFAAKKQALDAMPKGGTLDPLQAWVLCMDIMGLAGQRMIKQNQKKQEEEHG